MPEEELDAEEPDAQGAFGAMPAPGQVDEVASKLLLAEQVRGLAVASGKVVSSFFRTFVPE